MLLTRHPRGTQKGQLTVASFRPWRGSQFSAARDPIGSLMHASGEGGIRTREAHRLHAFQACALGHYATSPSDIITFPATAAKPPRLSHLCPFPSVCNISPCASCSPSCPCSP